MINLQDPALREQLRRRNPEGRYLISEAELVLAIRACDAQGDSERVRLLSEALVERCGPEFQRRTQGLRHRPDLREEAIANMVEHLLREALDSQEVFMTQNFPHYLRCLCADEFTRVLRQEGLHYRRDSEGRPAGQPQHIPRSLIESLQASPSEEEGSPGADVADPQDAYERLHALEESRRILAYLSDPLDRKIVVLRVFQGLKWDDIAQLCQRTERTVRLRYEKARTYLRACLDREREELEAALMQLTHQRRPAQHVPTVHGQNQQR
ncbi:RNA polymerase sigma factor [Thermogemmatispora carboxidivorans]|uniref:RNA polymerase sigma factor n=1 Tax=Thermogemmatispora carboxidivorans TaxID=1382306 RepID=UPI00069C8122|nr:sigma factor-like helix-turn-helix DNA-binding protein [Thermogemmatispora carboxidivorans]